MTSFFQKQTVIREKRGGTWLELFFDLVYVAILVELGSRLSSNFTLSGVIEFAALFVPIWWSWLALVFYTRYFPSDDIGQRALTAVYMFFMIMLAFEIHAVTSDTLSYFVVSYGFTKLVLAFMYLRAWHQFPEYRATTSHNAAIYFGLWLLWMGIAIVAPQNFWLWGLAIGIDILIPLIIRGSHTLRNKQEPAHPPLKRHYMLHRFGELTIIVLGEFFIKLIASSSGTTIQPFNFYLAACMLMISLSMWWLYFDHTDHVQLNIEQAKPVYWIYTHYFLLAAITAYGVVGTKVFAYTPGHVLSRDKVLLFCIALAIAVVALGIIDWASPEGNGRLSRKPHLHIRIVAALVLLGLAGLGTLINVGWFVTLAAIVFVVQVGIDIWKRLQNQDGVETAVVH